MPATRNSLPLTMRQRACQRYLRISPPSQRQKRNRSVKTVRQFDDAHRADATRLFDYITFPKSNYLRPRGHWVFDMSPARAYALNAINPEAHIAFSKIVSRHVAQHPEIAEGPLFFVTVTPRAYVMPLAQASGVNIVSLQRLTGQALQGCSFLGMVEAALYKGWGSQAVRELHDHVSWHTHNLVWGSTREEIELAISNIEDAHTNISGRSAVHVLEITAAELAIYLRYPLKAPMKEYRLRRSRYVTFDKETGELFFKMRQQKRDMRTGDRLRMCLVMRDMYLDKLYFGQGAGAPIARAIRAEALGEFNRREEAEMARREFDEHQRTLRRQHASGRSRRSTPTGEH